MISGRLVLGRAVPILPHLRQKRVAPGKTLAVLPEGAMINYLARRENPTPYINFMPLEVLVFGEGNILSAFERRPPDFVLLVHKDTSEYGPRFFGADYALRIGEWIHGGYEPVCAVGQPPLESDRFGMALLKRRQ